MTTILLTGESGAGKTSVVKAIADTDMLRSQSSRFAIDSKVFGVISLRKMNHVGERVGICAWLCPCDRFLDLAVLTEYEDDRVCAQDRASSAFVWYEGEEAEQSMCEPGKRLRQERRPGQTNSETRRTREDKARIGPWIFNRGVFDAVNEHLCREAVARPSKPGSVALIDEIGPLELRRNDGFIRGVETVVTSDTAMVAVVRPSLVEELTAWIVAISPRRRIAGVQVVHVGSNSKTAPTVEHILGMLDKS